MDLHEHHEEAYHSPVPWPWPKKSEVFVQENRCFFKLLSWLNTDVSSKTMFKNKMIVLCNMDGITG